MASLASKFMPQKQSPATEPGAAANTDLWRTSIFLGGVGSCGVLALFLWSMSLNSGSLTAFAFGFLLMAGTGLVGGVIGLLFGIPKSVSDPSSGAPPSGDSRGASPASNAEGRRPSYATNTNLEQISDWLTKILVGVGLTEIATIRQQFHALATYLGDGFLAQLAPAAAGPAASVIAAVIVIFGLTGGFVAGYLFTRIFLTGAFVRVDDGILQRRYTELKLQFSEERATNEEATRSQGEIYQELYRYADQGFRSAIEKLNALLSFRTNQRNPSLWVYLAAAHGQAYLWETEHPAPDAEQHRQVLDSHHSEALRAVTEALSLGDAWKPVLQQMWDVNSPIKTQGEDDLQVFYDDPDFRKLLGSN